MKAIGYCDPAGTSELESINEQQIVWSWVAMWSDSTWTFDQVVQIDEDVSYNQGLLNVIEAYRDSRTKWTSTRITIVSDIC